MKKGLLVIAINLTTCAIAYPQKTVTKNLLDQNVLNYIIKNFVKLFFY